MYIHSIGGTECISCKNTKLETVFWNECVYVALGVGVWENQRMEMEGLVHVKMRVFISSLSLSVD